MDETEGTTLLRLFPGPAELTPLEGLYLSEGLRPAGNPRQPFVYANFIASLDGRISLPDPRTGTHVVPPLIANPRDWRLFQELAACADVLVTSGRYVRDLRREVTDRSFPISRKSAFADLADWRRRQSLAPQPAVVIVTASLDIPRLDRAAAAGRPIYVATGAEADPRKVADLKEQGARVLITGDGPRVRGEELIRALAGEGLGTIAMIGGGEVLDTLIADDALDRLYLTQACRLLGGQSFNTLIKGPELEPPARFQLQALYYDSAEGDEVEQLFAVLDRRRPGAADRQRAPAP